MKKCKHKYESGTAVWKKGVIKILAECIYCKKMILFDFDYTTAKFEDPPNDKNRR